MIYCTMCDEQFVGEVIRAGGHRLCESCWNAADRVTCHWCGCQSVDDYFGRGDWEKDPDWCCPRCWQAICDEAERERDVVARHRTVLVELRTLADRSCAREDEGRPPCTLRDRDEHVCPRCYARRIAQ